MKKIWRKLTYMKYISIQEAAKKFDLSERSVRNYCAKGRIPGAILEGNTWLIPVEAKKPNRINGKEIDDSEELNSAYALLDFINRSPVSFFAIENVKSILLENGYQEVKENESHKFTKGEKVFFIRNNSSLVALNIGKELSDNFGFHIVASHSDSPCFKIKPEANNKSGIYNKYNVEAYGGLIRSTWLDRPLAIAGRVLIRNEEDIVSKLINLDDDFVMIPNTCIHFNREMNSGYEYNLATDMQPLVDQELDGDLLKNSISKKLKVKPEDIINFDLYLYNAEQGYIWGKKKEFISSSRLDDLECVYTSTMGFVNGNNDKAVNVLYISDNEEVGSSSRQGADSDFLESILKNVANDLNATYSVCVANSFLVSADNAHAVHPNRPELSDPNNSPKMNKGIAIKFNAAQSYTSDAISSAIFQKIAENSGVLCQFFTNRSDIRGGSTLGNILLSHVSLLSVDIGLAQLAMHSSFETAGTFDVHDAIKVFETFYQTDIKIDGNKYEIK